MHGFSSSQGAREPFQVARHHRVSPGQLDHRIPRPNSRRRGQHVRVLDGSGVCGGLHERLTVKRSGAPKRLAAVAALVLPPLILVLAVDIVIEQFPRGLIVLAGVTIAMAAAWYGLLRTGPARVLESRSRVRHWRQLS